MTRIKTIFISIIFILIVVLSIFLQSSNWRKTIETYVNHRLDHTEWKLQIPELRGNLLSTISGNGFQLTKKDGSEIILGKFKLRMNYFKSVFSHPTFSYLEVENIEIHPVFNKDSLVVNNKDTTSTHKTINDLNITIEDLLLSGSVTIPLPTDTFLIDFSLNSHLLIKPTDKEFIINEFSATLNDSLGYALLRNTSLKVFDTHAELVPANGIVNGLPFDGEIYYDWTIMPDLSGSIHVDQYNIPDQFFKNLPLKQKFSSLETYLYFESDLKRIQGDLTLKNPLGLLMKGELSLTRYDHYFSINRLSLESEETLLSITGIYEDSGRLSGNVLLTQFDLSKWMIDQKKTNINGTVMVEGTVKKNHVGDITMTLEINESELYGDRDISVSGTFFYNNDIFSFNDPLNISIGPSFVNAKGFVNIEKKEVDLDLKLNEASVFLINNFWSDSLKSGIATGDLRISGNLGNPTVRAELDCKNLSYKDMIFDNIILNADWTPSKSGGDGFFTGKIGNGSWRKYGFDVGLVDIAFSQEGIEIQSAEFKQGDNFLQISGLISPDSTLLIDHMQIAFENHYFINAEPFSVKYYPNKLEFYPFEIHIDDGIITGQMVIQDEIRGQFHLSNINADIMKLFTKDERYHVSGLSFGDISIVDVNDYPEVKLDVKLKNGIAAKQKFTELVLSGSIYKSILNVKEISMTYNKVELVTISGFIPIGKQKDSSREFDFYMIFNDLDLSLLTQFSLSKYFMAGKITGGYHLGGSPEKTIFDFSIIIEDAVWDQLYLGRVASEGLFDGQRLYLNKFSSEYQNSEMHGAAYLPIDYNISSKSFGQYFLGDSLWLIVDGHTNNLEFLTTYISTVDSITGDFNIELKLTGPVDRLIRDGYISSKDATIYSVQLDDPITHVNGLGKLKKNQFTWTSLTGSMVNNPNDNPTPNIQVSGTMDMRRFFKPYYHLKVKGEELHFRTLLGDMEGICNLDLTLTGRDTIEIAGVIEPVDAVMYQEFTQNSSVNSSDAEGSLQISYKLNFPITGNFALRNSQIDAHLSGELSLTKLGNLESNYGGELFVRGGKFYFNQNVFTISEGYMAFNKKGFNPYLDIDAFTKIKNEHITIKLIGAWDNPQIILESSSGFSESDIIELLTIGNRFEDQEISAKGFGNQAQNILGAYLERQLERNLLQATGINKSGIIDNVSISGTAGLLDPNNNQDFTISAERQISDNLSLNYSYKRSFSLSNPNTNKVGVELRINRYVSLVGNVDETGNMHVKYRLRYSY